MPFSHAICAAEETVLVTANGEITIRSAQRAVSDVQADPQFRPDYRVLVDLREMKYSPSTEDIRVLASTLGEARDSYRGKVAVVVSGKFQFGMARMAQTYAEIEGFAMCPFLDYEAARRWLDED